MGLADGGAVVLDIGHLFAGFGQVGHKAGQGIHRCWQRFQFVLTTPSAEAFPISRVRLGRVRRALQLGLDVAVRVLGQEGQRQGRIDQN